MKLHLDTLLSMTTTFTSMIGLCTRCTGVHWLCELPNSGYVQGCRDFSSIGAAVPLIPLTRPHPALRRPVSMTLGVCGEAVDHRQDQRFEGQGCTLWMQQACERFSYAVHVHPSRSSAQARRCCSMADCIPPCGLRRGASQSVHTGGLYTSDVLGSFNAPRSQRKDRRCPSLLTCRSDRQLDFFCVSRQQDSNYMLYTCLLTLTYMLVHICAHACVHPKTASYPENRTGSSAGSRQTRGAESRANAPAAPDTGMSSIEASLVTQGSPTHAAILYPPNQ